MITVHTPLLPTQATYATPIATMVESPAFLEERRTLNSTLHAAADGIPENHHTISVIQHRLRSWSNNPSRFEEK
jgi:hypothetical protein